MCFVVILITLGPIFHFLSRYKTISRRDSFFACFLSKHWRHNSSSFGISNSIDLISLSSHISRQKSFELLVELWESATATLERPPDRICDNVSPGAVGHRFLGLCLVSVRDLISTPSQTHVVSLQGRPFQDDLVLNWTITLQVRLSSTDFFTRFSSILSRPTFSLLSRPF